MVVKGGNWACDGKKASPTVTSWEVHDWEQKGLYLIWECFQVYVIYTLELCPSESEGRACVGARQAWVLGKIS